MKLGLSIPFLALGLTASASAPALSAVTDNSITTTTTSSIQQIAVRCEEDALPSLVAPERVQWYQDHYPEEIRSRFAQIAGKPDLPLATALALYQRLLLQNPITGQPAARPRYPSFTAPDLANPLAYIAPRRRAAAANKPANYGWSLVCTSVSWKDRCAQDSLTNAEALERVEWYQAHYPSEILARAKLITSRSDVTMDMAVGWYRHIMMDDPVFGGPAKLPSYPSFTTPAETNPLFYCAPKTRTAAADKPANYIWEGNCTVSATAGAATGSVINVTVSSVDDLRGQLPPEVIDTIDLGELPVE